MLWKYKKVYQETSEEACDCVIVNITISQTDLDNSDDGLVYSVFAECGDSEPGEKVHGVTGNYERCIKSDTEMILYILLDGIPVTAINSTAIKSTVCCSAPPNPNCFLLEEFQFTDTIPGYVHTVSVNAYMCNGSYLSFNEYSGRYTVNECIDISTIDVSSSAGIINSTYTLLQVQNAITSNGGDISRIITDGVDIVGSLRLRFGECI